MKNDILRIVDANLNRSAEGLRVCEDISRFLLEDPSLTRRLKAARHKINDTCTYASRRKLHESRDSGRDIGKEYSRIESGRSDSVDVFTANLQRVKESLRVLEEISKLFAGEQPARFKALRFKMYDIEKTASGKLVSFRGRNTLPAKRKRR
ncbi:MAG: thiamine-phosphate pyrophosphorylase [Candidatus Omnitrophota bacterium]